MLISKGNLSPDSLAGQVLIVTGAGRGIGLEACRSVVWLGGRVVMLEIDRTSGSEALELLKSEFGPDSASLVTGDVADERTVSELVGQAMSRFGRVDAVLNNATVTPMGPMRATEIAGEADPPHSSGLGASPHTTLTNRTSSEASRRIQRRPRMPSRQWRRGLPTFARWRKRLVWGNSFRLLVGPKLSPPPFGRLTSS